MPWDEITWFRIPRFLCGLQWTKLHCISKCFIGSLSPEYKDVQQNSSIGMLKWKSFILRKSNLRFWYADSQRCMHTLTKQITNSTRKCKMNNVATPRDLTNSLNALKMKRMHLHYLKIDLNPLLAMEASTYEHPPCKLLEACWCLRWRICFFPFVPFFALLRVMLKLVQLFLRLWTPFSLPPWPSVQHIEASVCPVEELFGPVGAWMWDSEWYSGP